VVLRNIASGKHAFLDIGNGNDVSCIALSKNGKYIASGQISRGTVKPLAIIWDLEAAQSNCDNGNCSRSECLIHRLVQHKGKVQSLSFSCDSAFLVTLGGQDDNDIVVWNVHSGNAICGRPAAKESSLCVRWLNNRNDRFVSCGNGHLRVWQVCINTPKLDPMDANMGSMQRSMTCLSISDDDFVAFVGTKTGEVLKFKIDRDEIKTFNEPDCIRPFLQSYNRERFSRGVKSVACIVNPDTGNINVIAGSGDGKIQVINPNMKLSKHHIANVCGGVTSLAMAPDGESFYTGTDLSQRYHVQIGTFRPKLCGTCHFGAIYDVKFPKDCFEIFVTASVEDIRVWNTKSFHELIRIKVPGLTCYAIDVSRCGSSIYSAWSDGKIRAFLPESGKLQFVIPDAHTDGVTSIMSYKLNNCEHDRLISGGKDGRVRVWKISKSHQTMLHSMKEHKGIVNCVKCNKDGTQAISGAADGSCIVWDLNNGIRVNAMFESTVFHDILFHPDESQYLSCGSNFKINYWDAYDGSTIRVIEGGLAAMTCLDIQPSGDFFVSGGADKLVKLWNYDTGLPLKIGRGHSGQVNKVMISPDQSMIVSVGSEGAIFVWKM